MSDGNFHRNLLPSTGYAGGVRAGRAAQTQRAVAVLERLLAERTALSADERRTFVAAFHAELVARP